MTERQLIMWTALIAGGMTLIILWQHATHSAAIVGLITNSGSSMGGAVPSSAPVAALWPQLFGKGAPVTYALRKQLSMDYSPQLGSPA